MPEQDWGFPQEALDYIWVRANARALLGPLHNHYPPIGLSAPWEDIEEALKYCCNWPYLLDIAAMLRREGIGEEELTDEWVEEAPVKIHGKQRYGV